MTPAASAGPRRDARGRPGRRRRRLVPVVLVGGAMLVAGTTDAFDAGAPPDSDSLLVEMFDRTLDVPTPPSVPAPPAPPAVGAAANVTPIVPGRVYESRTSATATTIDGQQQGTGRRAGGQTSEVVVAGRAGVPADVSSVFVNVTSIDPGSQGFVTVFSCGTNQPLASTVNYVPGRTVANGALVAVGDGGAICAFTSAPTHLVVDVTGFVPPGSGADPVVPGRLFDSRSGSGAGTIDGRQQNAGQRTAGETTTVVVAGRAGVPLDAAAVFVNVTGVGRGSSGYVTLFSCEAGQPLTSTLNVPSAGAAANGALVEVDASGSICVYTSAASDLIVDVTGHAAANRGLAPMFPGRVFETRAGPNAATIDGLQQATGRQGGGTTAEIVVSERASIPFAAGTVFVNATVIDPAGVGYVTLFPCGSERPRASTLNYRAGETVANGAIVLIGEGGAICAYSSESTHLAVDVTGFGI